MAKPNVTEGKLTPADLASFGITPKPAEGPEPGQNLEVLEEAEKQAGTLQK